jgi:hypothetical protein
VLTWLGGGGTEERIHYRHKLKDNIKMDLREIGWGSSDWIDVAQDRCRFRSVVNIVMNFELHKMREIS